MDMPIIMDNHSDSNEYNKSIHSYKNEEFLIIPIHYLLFPFISVMISKNYFCSVCKERISGLNFSPLISN